MVRYRNPENPITSFQDLTAGLETTSRITDRTAGSASLLENFLVTESKSLKAITGYKELIPIDFSGFCTDNAHIEEVYTKPLQISDTLQDEKSYLYFLAKVSYEQDAPACGCSKTTYDIAIIKALVHPIEHQPSDVKIVQYLKCDIAGDNNDYRGYRALYADKKILFYGENKTSFLYDTLVPDPNNHTAIASWHYIAAPDKAVVTKFNIKDADADGRFRVRVAISWVAKLGRTDAPNIQTLNVGEDVPDWKDDAYIAIDIQQAPPEHAIGWHIYLAISEAGKDNNQNVAQTTNQAILYRITDEMIPVNITTARFFGNKKAADAYTSATTRGCYKFFIDQRQPQTNSTIPLRFNEAAFINNRIWITQMSDADKQYRVYWSGVNNNIWDFSDGSDFGNGYMAIDGGSDNYPLRIINFRTNDGSPAINILTGNAGSLGKRWAIESRQITEGDYTYNTFVAIEQVNAWGTYAPDSVMTSDNDLFFFSQQGIITTKTSSGYYNVLANTNISLKIKNIIDSLETDNINIIDACYDKTRIVWLLKRKDGSNFLLLFDYVFQAYSIVTIDADKIFTVFSDDLIDTTLCFTNKDGLFYLTCSNTDIPEDQKLINRVEFNYQPITETRVARPFGRIVNVQMQFESLEQGDMEFHFNGLTKDNVLVSKSSPFSEKEDNTDDKYLVYNAYVHLYREYYVVDEFSVGFVSRGTALVITEYSVQYAPITRDWGKNRSGRQKGTLIPS